MDNPFKMSKYLKIIQQATFSYFKGQMVGKGTFPELLQSGIDFASLLKSGEEEQSPTQDGQLIKSARIRTFSQSSVWSQDSSVQSQKEGATDALLVSRKFYCFY